MSRRWAGGTATAFALLATMAARSAGAETPALPGTGGTATFASLPEGHLASLPDAPGPKHIGASEKIDGLSVPRPPVDRDREPYLALQKIGITNVFAAATTAPQPARTPETGSDIHGEACLIDGGEVASPSGAGTQDDAEPRDWPGTCQSQLALRYDRDPIPANPGSERGRKSKRVRAPTDDVHAVRSERFVPGEGGSASLAVVDAWVDARTRGVRLIGRATLPLSRVFVGPNGVEVYAAHDGSALQVVLHAGDAPGEDPAIATQMRARSGGLNVSLPDRDTGNSDSRHLRFTLRAPPGAGQMATYQSVAFLPSLDVAGDAPEGESDDARALRLVQAMRLRPFQLSVSATRSSADATPIVSIALGWTGRDQR